MNHISSASPQQRICVLELEGPVLMSESDHQAAALELYRCVRSGAKVVALVPAMASAASMTLALSRIGVSACTSENLDLSQGRLEAGLLPLLDHEVVVVPGGVAGPGAAEASAPAHPDAGERLRVALLGCGAVGAGVLEHLQSRPDLFEVSPVLVRDPGRRAPEERFTDCIKRAMGKDPHVLVELIGGADYPAEIMCSALHAGVHVVTANKAAVAKSYDALHACARAGGATLAYSAAVGGGAPILETLRRLKGRVVAVEGVMNGTANFVLSKLGEGWAFDEAIAKAQVLGFAEADPAADLDGHDAADKLSLLLREGFGLAVPPERIARESLRSVTPAEAQRAIGRGQALKQVGRCSLSEDGGIVAEVKIESLPAEHPLAGARNEENRFLIRDSAGAAHHVRGKGAGRWPTAAAVFADLMDIRSASARGEPDQAAIPLRLRA